MNFPVPVDLHRSNKDVPVVIFKSKEKKVTAEEPKVKKVTEVKKVMKVEAPKPAEVKPTVMVEVKKEVKVEAPKKKIRFEKGSAEAMQFGKEMALRRKMKKEAMMKEKVVEVKEEPNPAEAAPVEVKA